MARIVLNTFGSFGDLHPFLALAIALKKRGHSPVLVSAEVYRAKVEAKGIEFAPSRPDLGALAGNPEVLKRVWDPKRGTEYLLREIVLPDVAGAFNDLEAACGGADLLINHTAGFAGPLVAEKNRLRWLSAVLQPMAFLSAYDPPVLAHARWVRYTRRSSAFFRLLKAVGRWQTRRWAKPIFELRRKLGLSPGANPLFEGQFSPAGTLALFSRGYAAPQRDWPPETTCAGFLFFDELGAGFESRAGVQDKSIELERFLAGGPPPVLFTLGSSAVMQAGSFFAESMEAARQLGVRAVLLVGREADPAIYTRQSESIFITDYLPFGAVMPQVSAVVHQGGIGTTAQTLRAGKPMLVVPWSHDQPDNADRIRRLGAGLVLERRRYSAINVAGRLERLLSTSSFRDSAARLGSLISGEDGLSVAADAVERHLEGIPRKS